MKYFQICLRKTVFFQCWRSLLVPKSSVSDTSCLVPLLVLLNSSTSQGSNFQKPISESIYVISHRRVLAQTLRNFLVDPRLLSGRNERDGRHCYQLCRSLQVKVKVGLAKDGGGVEQIESCPGRMWRYWKIGCEEHHDRDAAQKSCSKDLQISAWARNRSCDFIFLCNLQSGNH